MTNPYAPPRASVEDLIDPRAPEIPAERGTRLGAAILDNLIFVVMVYLPFMVGVLMALPESEQEMADAGVEVLFGTGGVITLIGFGIWLWVTLRFMKANGQSIAKKLLGIKVVRADGSAVSLSRLIWLRNVMTWILSLIPLYGFIDILFIFGESRQCLHDKMADTIVVRA